MPGLQLTADLEGCDAGLPAMVDATALRGLCMAAAEAAGLRVVAHSLHAFGPGGGVTGVLLLAESHLAVHTWPELGQVTLEVYVCNVAADHAARARTALDHLSRAFAPARERRQRLTRGPFAAPPRHG